MNFRLRWVLIVVLLGTVTASAQEFTRGSLLVAVSDPTGAVIPGATVTVISPRGELKQTTFDRGEALFLNLVPGLYDVRVEMTSFKSYKISGVEVRLNERSTITVKLEVGAVTQTVEVTETTVGPDLSSTSTGANISVTLYEKIPLGRNVVDPLYLSAGVGDSGGAGRSNPSIGGASGLENLYLIDGVNNTNTGFGGFGTYSRVFGSVGSGVTTSFIQEIQVKTGGMEAQYGQALGGVISMITKTGGNKFHGAGYAYYSPRAASASFNQPNRFRTTNFLTETHGIQQVDFGAELSGRVIIPGLYDGKDKFFWFGSINPVYTHTARSAPPGQGFLNLGQKDQIRRVNNYAGKLTYRINPNHQVEASIFGDPTIVQFGPNRSLVVTNDSSFSRLNFRGLNWQVRYNGILSSKWVFTASVGQNHNRFDEERLTNQYRITDFTGPRTTRRGGVGFFENTKGGADFQANFDTGYTANTGRFGQHQINVGLQFEASPFDGVRRRTGPDWFLPTGDPKIRAKDIGARVFGADVSLFNCVDKTGSPDCFGQVPSGVYFRQTRGDFAGSIFGTGTDYTAAYAQDNWQLNKYVTIKAGLRWEEENIQGSVPGFSIDCPVGFANPVTGEQPTVTKKECNYAFTNSWGPRIGVVIDPWGNRKGKAYASFGRFFERIPQDLSERSIVPETSYLKLIFKADADRVPRLDQAHFIPSNASSCNDGSTASICGQITAVEKGAVLSAGIPTVIAAGTKMQYQDEFVVGFERELPHGIVLGVRYQDRRLKRIVEDSAAFTTDQANAGGNQQFVIQNVSAATDNFRQVVTVNNPGGLVGNPLPTTDPTTGFPVGFPANTCQSGTLNTIISGGVVTRAFCFTPASGLFGPDGIPDGFVDPVREYQAVEITFERRFQRNWQILSNFRISRLRGNFEGSFRNDNGQQDPNISSLFDFTSSGPNDPLADQFRVGLLPTDRRYVLNFYGSYLFDKGFLNGLNLGTGVRVQSGTPISEFNAHPVYENPGELPVGGRGKLGRTPVNGTVDFHADYTYKLTERFRVKTLIDLFNIANSNRKITRIDQFREQSLGQNNPDFLRPLAFQEPFRARFAVRLEW